MTGLDVAHDRIVEVCVERWVGSERVASRTPLSIPASASEEPPTFTGFGALESRGAPRFAGVAKEVLGTLRCAILVAHAAAWDVGSSAAECARAG